MIDALNVVETLYFYEYDYDYVDDVETGGIDDEPETRRTVSDASTTSSDNENTPRTIENSIIGGRRYYSNNSDSLTGLSNFNLGLLAGNDFLEVIGGVNNFANGNDGDDHIIIRGGLGRYLGGASNDRLEVYAAEQGSWVNGNNGMDVVIGSVEGVTYRGGSENDILQVSAGTLWGDRGADTFQAVAGAGVAIIQDYTVGEDFVRGVPGGSFTMSQQGLNYGVEGDSMLVFLGITNASMLTLIS